MKKQVPATAAQLPGTPGPAMKRLLSQKELLAVHGGGKGSPPSAPSPGNH